MRPEAIENKEQILRLYNLSQLFLIKYQMAAGLIAREEDYIDNGTAELFEMIANLHLQLKEVDWAAAREEVEKITGGSREQVSKMYRP